jgi:hypothetical protein
MRALVLASLLSLFSLPVQAQTLWSRPYEPNQLTVEAIVPDAATEGDFPSGVTFVTGTASLSDNIELTAELPFARYRPSAEGAGTTTALGNPFVGLGLSSTTVPFLFEVGARIPAAPSNEAARIGGAADVGRTPAFGPDEFSLSALVNGRLEVNRFSTARFRTGFEFSSRPDPSAPDRIQKWRLRYDVQLWREGERFITGFTFTGRTRLSRAGTSQHHASFSIMPNWNVVQPGLLAGTSLDDLFGDGRWVPFVGLTLSVSYGRL